MNLKQAIVFAILMENDKGILGKAPSYVEEKLRSCEQSDKPEALLDTNNQAKFLKWQEKWGILESNT